VFRPEPSITHLPIAREQVVAVVESINQPQVSVPGKAPQAVVGHLCGVRNANGTFSIYIGLHLAKAGENVVYVNDRAQLGMDDYRTVEIEGLQFLESMGFMLDNLNFRNLAPALQAQTFERIPLFHPPRPPGSVPAAASGAPVAAPPPAAPAAPLTPADGKRLAHLLSAI
jgi:hypothetical protein